MKKLRIFPILLAVCLVFCTAAPAASALDEPEMVATNVVLADIGSERILYSRNMTDKVAPASLTKIMTVLIAVEALESGEIAPDEMITAQSDCRIGMDEESSTAGIIPGEEMSFQNLIYCAMLASANEACNIIGTRLAGSISAFVDRMNRRAETLGMTGTHFANTNGLTDEQHYTTAYDFYLLAREAIKHPEFMAVCNTAYYEVPATNVCDMRKLNNSNALISDGSIYGDSYLYPGTSGVKTGYTRAAGYCLISTCEREGINVLAVVMGSTGALNSDRTDYGNFVDSISLYDWAFENFAYKTILTTEPLTKVDVALAKDEGSVNLRPRQELTALLPVDVADSDISLHTVVYEDKLVAPIEAGTELGQVTVSVRGENFGTVKLVNISAVELSRSEYIKLRLHAVLESGWFKAVVIILGVFILAYITLVARYRRLRRKHMRERRAAEQRRRLERERQAVAPRPQAPQSTDSGTRKFSAEDEDWR